MWWSFVYRNDKGHYCKNTTINMKKLLLTIVAMLLSVVAMAEKVEIDGVVYDIDTTNRTAKVNNGRNCIGDIIIPGIISYQEVDYKVTSIGMDAFNRAFITSIIISDGITTLERNAFQGY